MGVVEEEDEERGIQQRGEGGARRCGYLWHPLSPPFLCELDVGNYLDGCLSVYLSVCLTRKHVEMSLTNLDRFWICCRVDARK